MAKIWLALGAAAAIGAAALTTSTPASAHWRGEGAAAGSVLADDDDGACYGRPRGLFNFGGASDCACPCRPQYYVPAAPAVQPDCRQYSQPYEQPYYPRYGHRYYQRYSQPHLRHDFRRHESYRQHDHRHVQDDHRPMMHHHHRNW